MREAASSGDKKHELCGYCYAYIFFTSKMREGFLTKQVNSVCDLSLYAPANFMRKLRKFQEESQSERCWNFWGKWEWGQNTSNFWWMLYFSKRVQQKSQLEPKPCSLSTIQIYFSVSGERTHQEGRLNESLLEKNSL